MRRYIKSLCGLLSVLLLLFLLLTATACSKDSQDEVKRDLYGDGKGITWGLSHVNVSPIDPSNYRRIVEQNSFLIRFDCDLHRDFDLSYFKNPRDQVGRFSEETFFQPKMVLEEHAKKEALERMKRID